MYFNTENCYLEEETEKMPLYKNNNQILLGAADDV
jgi:hypothetical protein